MPRPTAMEIGVHAWSSVGDDVDQRFKAMFKGRSRKIGRYVRFAQVGAALCAEGMTDAQRADIGIFLGTGMGNTADIVPLARGMMNPVRQRQSPIAFAGSVGNSAAFYVARALGALGPNITVSQEELSFEAAVLQAWVALSAGRVRTALVGAVDVQVGSDHEHRERMNAQGLPGQPTEGAAFVLLGTPDGAPFIIRDVFLGSVDDDTLLAPLPTGCAVLPGFRMRELTAPAGCHVMPAETRLTPSATALRLVDVLTGAEPVASDAFAFVHRTAKGAASRLLLSRR